jgi:hypothetical protein
MAAIASRTGIGALRIRCAVIWLLALLLPFQALTAVYLDMRGPAHVHVDDDAHHHHGHDHAHAHLHPHAHGKHRVERHHHRYDDPSVVVVHDGGTRDSQAAEMENKPGWSATMLAALPAGAALLLPRMLSVLSPRPQPVPRTRYPGRLERPPRPGAF